MEIKLRSLNKKDAAAIEKYASDKRIARTTRLPHPYPRGGGLQFVQKTQKDRHKNKGDVKGICVDGLFVGVVGLHDINKNDKNAEVGYWIGHEHWGRGIATEAVKQIVSIGFGTHKLKRLYAEVIKDNKGSICVLEKNGFIKEGIKKAAVKRGGRYYDVNFYGNVRDNQ